jgi:hypothetical protein
MKVMKKLNKLPKWFNGTIYDTGEIVTNPFSGEEYKLTNLELSMYDFIMGAQMTFAVHQERQPNTPISEKLIKDFEKGLDWFRKTNAKAYMVLLD